MRGGASGEAMLRQQELLKREAKVQREHPVQRLARERVRAMWATGKRAEVGSYLDKVGQGSTLQIGLNPDPTLGKFLKQRGPLSQMEPLAGGEDVLMRMAQEPKGPSSSRRFLEERYPTFDSVHGTGGGFGKQGTANDATADMVPTWRMESCRRLGQPHPDESLRLRELDRLAQRERRQREARGMKAPKAKSLSMTNLRRKLTGIDAGTTVLGGSGADVLAAIPGELAKDDWDGDKNLLYTGVSSEYEGRYAYLKKRRQERDPQERLSVGEGSQPLFSSHEIGWRLNGSKTKDLSPSWYAPTVRGTMLRLFSQDCASTMKNEQIVEARQNTDLFLKTLGHAYLRK